jgi:TolB-like protein/Flp pilus assembly protein TadD
VSLFEELKRRNVIRVGVAYVIVAWLVAQVAEFAIETFGAPDWVLKIFVVFLMLGFPVAVVFAWAFEMTPEGLRKEKDVDRSQSITSQTAKKLNNTILVLMALAIVYLLFDKFSAPAQPGSDHFSQQTSGQAQPGSDHFSQQAAGQTTNANEKSALTPVEAIAQASNEAEPIISRQSIAVLPFDNRSPDANDAYFAEGIHDDLLTNLSRIGALKVISRTSVAQYKGTEKTIPQIAAELGVATIMEGAVQRSGNQVRINVQLIDAQTDEHLWAEIFDRELTASNLFAIQSEISEAIASALEATLTSDEQQQINTVPTQNLLAYEAYLRGKQLMATRNASNLEQALAEFETAVKLDPQFALAWVGKADTLTLLPGYSTYPAKESFEKAKAAIERALAINDRLGEAYASLSRVLRYQNEWDLAEAALKKSIELTPNYATAWLWYSGYLSNFPLRIDESLEMVLKAYELDPYSAIIGSNLADKYRQKGLYSMSERQGLRVIELNPTFAPEYASLGYLYSQNLGQLAKAIPFFEKANELAPDDIWQKIGLLNIYLEIGDFQTADAIRNKISELSPDHPASAWADVWFNLYQSNHAATREAISYALSKAKDNPGSISNLAWIESMEGDQQQALDIFLVQFPGWMIPEQWTGLINQYFNDGCLVSWLLMQSGEEALGRRLLSQTSQFLEHDLPSVMEHADLYLPEVCQAARGDFEKALTSMQTSLNHNHLMYWKFIHRLPMFDPLRDDPRYIAILQEYERKIAVQRAEIDAMRAEVSP